MSLSQLGPSLYSFVYFKNYQSFYNTINNKTKPEIVSILAVGGEEEAISDWKFNGHILSTNFKTSDESLFKDIVNHLKTYDNDEYLIVNTQETCNEDNKLLELNMNFFYFVKEDGIIKDYLKTNVDNIENYYFNTAVYENDEESYLKKHLEHGAVFFDNLWIYPTDDKITQKIITLKK
ncbi:hypothetical protein SCLARK_001884 [Spiroplasma clarkii]|uniref:Uncharacterized protein n=1 Tax=Spiroplasma clarkii TaxID=2139 RepID=A0A1Y0L2Q9_9MOLU|nr:hypothetical protein [Spiroplasma clarkii]ARU92314.1 hypothetical protein SCLARK_001884 [Spiroplasma clarkii]ATX71625.1 hypothetical protein SCLAR_v1c13270 [Spiroplasma clarkii]